MEKIVDQSRSTIYALLGVMVELVDAVMNIAAKSGAVLWVHRNHVDHHPKTAPTHALMNIAAKNGDVLWIK